MKFDANPVAVLVIDTERQIAWWEKPLPKPDPAVLSELTEDKLWSRFETCIKYIDFNKIERVMQFLNWKWLDSGVPSQTKMHQVCHRLCKHAIESVHERIQSDLPFNTSISHATGGFVVKISKYGDVSVRFELESWDEEAR